MSLDWPTGWERTPPEERTKARKFEASLAATTSALQKEMDRMDVDEYRGSIGNSHTKSDGLPLHNADPHDPGFVLRWTDDGEQFAVACDDSPRLRDNVRTVFLWVHETRLRAQRPVKTGDSEFAAARLPSGEDDDVIAADPPAHEVLGVAPDAPESVIKAAARERIKETHPDGGGDRESFQRVKRAKEDLLNGG